MTKSRSLLISGLACLAGVLVPATAHAAPSATGDFDGDGRSELAIGAPMDSVAGRANAGAVNGIDGTSGRGPREDPDQQFTQGTRGIRWWVEAHDRFGRTLVAADGDGDFDHAVGTPLEDFAAGADAGAVAVLYGADGGISRRDDLWHQGSRGINGTQQASDNFGFGVAAGDFDADGRWDLVANAPRDSVEGFAEAGAVNVVYGHRGGLREDPDQLWTRGTRGIKGAVGSDRFGAALSSGAPGG